MKHKMKMLFRIVALLTILFYTGISQTVFAQPDVSRDFVPDIEYNPIHKLVAIARTDDVGIYTANLRLLTTLPRDPNSRSRPGVAWRPDGLQLAMINGADITVWDYDPLTNHFTQSTTIQPIIPAYYDPLDTSILVRAVEWQQQLAVTYLYQPSGLNLLPGVIALFDPQTWTATTVIENPDIFGDPSLFMLAPYIAISPTGDQLITSNNFCRFIVLGDSCDFPSVMLADTASGQIVWQYETLVDVFDVAWSPDGSRFAISADEVFIFDATTRNLIFTWEDILDYPTYIEWSDDSQRLISLNAIGEAQILDTQSYSVISDFQVNVTIERIRAIEWNSSTESLFVGANDRVIRSQYTATDCGSCIVETFHLIDPVTGDEISQLKNSDVIDLATFGSNLQIRADLSIPVVGSVVFDLNSTVQTDDTTPYDFTNWTPSPGQYTLTATPYSESGGAGTAGTPLTISFTVVDNGVTCTTTIPAGDTPALTSAIVTANGETEPQTICLEDSTYALTVAHNSDGDGANGLPVITGDITIVGNGATIERASGAPAFRIFKVDSGGRLALEGVTIRGGDAGSDEGGGIYNVGTLELDGVTIADNQAEAGGGIVSTGSLTAANSTIQDNTAYDGAGLLGDSGSSTTLTEVTISGNVAHSSWGLGGGVWLNGDLSMSGGSLSSNNARNGGGMFVNNAPNPVTLSNVTISNNGASRHGGGIYSNNGTVELDGVTFSGNIGLYFGGGIRNGDQMTVTSGDFSGNTGQDGGGGIANFGTLTVTDTDFDANLVDSGYGLGGGIFSQGMLTVTGGSLTGHTVYNGGALFVDGSSASLTAVSLSGNVANNSGGGIFGTGSATLTVSGGDISGNEADGFGGGIASDGTFTISGTLLSQNSTNFRGGAIYTDASSSNAIHASCIEGNTAPNGGGIYSDGVTVDATGNWWGAADGPSGAGPGSGDAVSQNVDFANFNTVSCEDAQSSVGLQALTTVPSGTTTATRSTPYLSDFDSSDGWQRSGSWALVRRGGVDDSPAWQADATIRDTESILSTPFMLAVGNSRNVRLQFQQRGQLGAADRVVIELLPAGSSDWVTLDEQVGLDSDWTQREINLADYRGESVQLRWRLVTAPERDTTADSYSLDDVAVGH